MVGSGMHFWLLTLCDTVGLRSLRDSVRVSEATVVTLHCDTIKDLHFSKAVST